MAAVLVLTLDLQNDGTLRALASVRVGTRQPAIINAYRVVQQEGQKAFVQPPQIVRVRDGKETFGGPIVILSSDLRAVVDAAILTAYESELKKRGMGAAGEPTYKGGRTSDCRQARPAQDIRQAYSTSDIPGYRVPPVDESMNTAETGAVQRKGATNTPSSVGANAENEPASRKQIKYAVALGHKGAMPASKKAVSELIDGLVAEKKAREARDKAANPGLGI